jgi:von Willebrand factor type A domain
MSAAPLSNLLLAQTDSTAGRVVYELSRLHDYDDNRLPLALLAVAVVVIASLVLFLYRRDTVELSRGLRILLAGLRFIALTGLLVYFLGIERRTNREVVHNSQVAVLVDVSQSMALNEGNSTESAKPTSRLDEVVATLAKSPLVEELRCEHDVHVARFDKEVQPIVSLPKITAEKTQHLDSIDNGLPNSPTNPAEQPAVDWSAELTASGTETRLGDALDEQFRLYRNSPLAGVVVISDGAQNAGMEPSAAVEAAQQAKVPIFTIGVGSAQPRRNVAVSDFLVPSRAFPGDSVTITGFLQATGYAGQFIDVELLRRGADEAAGTGTSVASQRVALGADGEIVPVTFEIKPDEPKRYVFQFRAAAPADDDPRDNQRESEMDVVDHKTRVLLFASGPSRDYRFLRDQLHRDSTMKADVLLQTGQPGISQDANDILSSFPATREELYQYDCIVAFDPDWTKLDAAQVALLESWVADEAGGMIVVPGPIHSAKWIRSSEHAKLLDLYPVVFQQRLTLLDDGHFRGDTASPLEFDRAGRDARFLWLANTAEETEAAWSSYPGVYGYYAIKGEKPGATVYARVADPESGLGDQHPVYIAGQFYGAGQVLYIGSGEFWRLRALDTTYFEVLYTKLIRHVSQGRLLRGSSRGALLVDRDRYELGETVVLRARLSNARHEPLTQDTVVGQVMRPDNSADSVKLQADPQHPGLYVGQFTAHQEGTYQVVLPVPDSNEEPFSKYLQVRVPDLERAHPERNEPLLAGLAKETGGQYYAQLADAVRGKGEQKSLPESIESRAEVKLIKGAPDAEFAQLQMRSLLGVIAGSLFLEWILRRLNRLA